MRRSVLIRLVIFSIAIVVALIYLTPTLIDKEKLPSWWGTFLPTDRINLGVDLQGGTHMILEVKVDKAVENNVERAKEDIKKTLREKGVQGVSVDSVHGIQIHLSIVADSVERVRGVLKSDLDK